MIEPRQALDRLRHQMPGVERQDDLVVALDPELFRQQPEVFGGAFPIDEAIVESGCVVPQRLELGAFALLLLDLDPIDRVAAEELDRRRRDTTHIGQHIDLPGNGYARRAFRQREWTAPSQPEPINEDLAATPG